MTFHWWPVSRPWAQGRSPPTESASAEGPALEGYPASSTLIRHDPPPAKSPPSSPLLGSPLPSSPLLDPPLLGSPLPSLARGLSAVRKAIEATADSPAAADVEEASCCSIVVHTIDSRKVEWIGSVRDDNLLVHPE